MIDGIKITGLEDVRRLLKSVSGESLDILVAGMNKGIARARTVSIKQITDEVNLSKKEVSATLRTRKVKKDGTGQGYVQCKNKRGWPVYNKAIHGTGFANAHLTFGGQRQMVPRLGVASTTSNRARYAARYSFQFKHQHPRKEIPGAFFARMKNGRRGIFIRKGRGRLPITEVMSSTPADVLSNPDNIKGVRDAASEAALAYIKKEVARILSH